MDRAIDVQGLTKSYRRQVVLASLDFQVEYGSAVGLLGANGAGKTTLLKALLGLLDADSGTLQTLGEPSRELTADARGKIAYVPQTPNQFSWLTGRSMLRYLAAFYPSFDWEYANALSEQWKVSLKTPISVLSPGQQQRLSIVRALATRPELLVLDEPIASLDPATRIAVIDELIRERSRRRVTVLFSSHVTADLERLCTDFVWKQCFPNGCSETDIQGPGRNPAQATRCTLRPVAVLRFWGSPAAGLLALASERLVRYAVSAGQLGIPRHATTLRTVQVTLLLLLAAAPWVVAVTYNSPWLPAAALLFGGAAFGPVEPRGPRSRVGFLVRYILAHCRDRHWDWGARRAGCSTALLSASTARNLHPHLLRDGVSIVESGVGHCSAVEADDGGTGAFEAHTALAVGGRVEIRISPLDVPGASGSGDGLDSHFDNPDRSLAVAAILVPPSLSFTLFRFRPLQFPARPRSHKPQL